MVPVQMPVPITRALAALTGLSQAETFYRELAALESEDFFCSLLDRLQIGYRLSVEEKEQLPRGGATIVVANHPFGILDGVILTSLLLSVRSDVKLFGNTILNAIPELAKVIIPVDTGGQASSVVANVRGVREAHRHLSKDGLLVVFPAGK